MLKVTVVMPFLTGGMVISVEVYQESSSKDTLAEFPEYAVSTEPPADQFAVSVNDRPVSCLLRTITPSLVQKLSAAYPMLPVLSSLQIAS